MYITVCRRTNPIDFGEYRMNSLFTGVQKKNSYTLRPMESNSLKDSSIQTMHSIEFKFGMYITGHHRANPVDFVKKKRTHSFFFFYIYIYKRNAKNNSYMVYRVKLL